MSASVRYTPFSCSAALKAGGGTKGHAKTPKTSADGPVASTGSARELSEFGD